MREGVNKVALRLFEHNEKAYHAAVRMMDQYGKAAIVHPTGTGKSYIAFKLIEDNPEKVVIWLSPSEYIFKTQLESLKRNDPEFPLENVHFYTYAKLMCCTQAQLGEIAAQKPAYIILDEFHRAGAECWGESTVALLKLCSDAKLLGLTATNIRYLDNNRDMAEELFDNRVASDMTLGEAVVRGILPAPKYVTTVYQYQKALAKYQARVDNLRTPGIQDVNQKYLDALRRALEQADGLDRVFLNIPVPNTAKSQLESSARHSTVSMKMWYCPLFPKCSKLLSSMPSMTEPSLSVWCRKRSPASKQQKLRNSAHALPQQSREFPSWKSCSAKSMRTTF